MSSSKVQSSSRKRKIGIGLRKKKANWVSAREASTCETPQLNDINKQRLESSTSNQHFYCMKTAIDAFVSKVLAKGVAGLCKDFEMLRSESFKDPKKEDIKSWLAHPELNRYKNILCWEKTRVKLAEHPNGRDYIHASLVSGPLYPDRFICAQGPMQDTCYDFWLMIFEQKCMSILQLCKFEEDGHEKCVAYYPSKPGNTLQFRDIRVTCTDVKRIGTPGVVYQRIFNVFKGEVGKDILHLSFESWPDHGVPPIDTTLLTVLQKLRMSTNYPILVHCSAGIGRTGTVVAIENTLESIMLGKIVEPHEIVAKLRNQRRHAVQRESQFLFINRLVLEYFLQMKQIQPTPEIEAFFADYEKAVAPKK